MIQKKKHLKQKSNIHSWFLNFSTLRTEDFFNLMKCIYKQTNKNKKKRLHLASIAPNSERMSARPLTSWTNKTKMSSLTTSTYHLLEVLFRKKKYICHPCGKQRSNTGFILRRHDYLGDNWIESSKKATRTSEFIKAAWYKMNTQTSIRFLYASNEQSEI